MDVVVVDDDDHQNTLLLAGLDDELSRKKKKKERERLPGKGKGKGKVPQRETSMMIVDEDEDASVVADVSMMDVSMGDIIIVDSPTPALAAAARRKETMLPPPIIPPFTKSRPPLVRSTSRGGSISAIHIRGPDPPVRNDHSNSTTPRVISAPSAEADPPPRTASKPPEIKLHPLLAEKKYLNESRRAHTAPNPNVTNTTNAGNPSGGASNNAPARVLPITSVSSDATGSQSPVPPGASQSRQAPPRLGMCRSRTAPLLPLPTTSSNVPPIGPANLVATQSVQNKNLAKPFRPPFRAAAAAPANSASRSAAYPSPSPGSGDDGKNGGDQSVVGRRDVITTSEVVGAYGSRRNPPREHSPPVLPPTPESVSKSAFDPVKERRGKGGAHDVDDDDEKMEDLAAPDPDSSFGDMTFDFSMDVLEETMKKYD
jgi:hypothetical protein